MGLPLDVLILSILCGQVALFAYMDRILWRTLATPTTMLSVPYTIVVLLVWIFGPQLDFAPLFSPSVIIWIVSLMVVWLVGLGFALMYRSFLSRHNSNTLQLDNEQEAQNVSLALVWIIYPILIIRLLQLLSRLGGFDAISTDEFAEQYGRGIFAHLMVLSYPMLILLIGTVGRKQWLIIFTILVGLSLIFVYQVKSWMIVPILAGLIYRWTTGRIRVSARLLFSVLILMIILFFGSYLLGFGANDPAALVNPDVYLFLARHFANYLFAGVLAFSETMKYGFLIDVSAEQVFAPVINIYRVLVGEKLVTQINPTFLVIGYLGQTSNVNTLFGTLVLMLGPLVTFFYTIGMAITVFGIYSAVYITRNCWIAVIWVFLAAMMCLGWFELYFSNLTAIEVPLICLLFAIFLPLISRQRAGHGQADMSLDRSNVVRHN